MGRKGQSITLSVSEQDKVQLEAIAREQGMLWGDRPNISRLVEAIARREVLIGRNHDWSQSRIKALHQSIQVLIDAGHPDAAAILVQLLIERSEVPIPLRHELEQLLHKPIPAWRSAIDHAIHRQTPFRLMYRDAADTPRSFTIRYAQITPYERRQYLECWCEETEGNRDIPDLQHNWTLRLDRIAEAALTPLDAEWRSRLDVVVVEFYLLGGLAFAYEPKPNDTVSEWLSPSDLPIRRVVRQISNSFWFFREVLRYGEDCIIISPASVRDQFKQKLLAVCQHYGVAELEPQAPGDPPAT